MTEYVDAPTARLVDEVEASSFEEAHKIAKQRNPNLGAMKIDNAPNSPDGKHLVVEYN